MAIPWFRSFEDFWGCQVVYDMKRGLDLPSYPWVIWVVTCKVCFKMFKVSRVWTPTARESCNQISLPKNGDNRCWKTWGSRDTNKPQTGKLKGLVTPWHWIEEGELSSANHYIKLKGLHAQNPTKPSEKFPNATSSTQLNSTLIDFEWFFFSFHLFPTFYQIQFPDLSKIFQNIPDDGSFLI